METPQTLTVGLPVVDQWLANSTVLSDEEFGGPTKKKKGKQGFETPFPK